MLPNTRALVVSMVVLSFVGGNATRARADDVSSAPLATVAPGDVQWKADPRGPGIFTAVVAGDPKQAGLYVLRVKMLADARLPPHRHPDLRSVTVLSGEFYLGLGEVFDVAKMKAYPAGSHIVIPPNVPHFGWVKSGESIQQDCGWGPTGSAAVTTNAAK